MSVATLQYGSIARRLERLDERRIEFRPRFTGDLQPASIDVQLGHAMKYWDEGTKMFRPMARRSDGVWILQPGILYLGVLLQFIRIPVDCLGRLEGKSSLGRQGIQLHRAGILDPSWYGCATTEMDVLRKDELVWPGMVIGQVTFELLDEVCEMPYGSPELGSHYQGDTEPMESKLIQAPRLLTSATPNATRPSSWGDS
jgi:dCTP deaminase